MEKARPSARKALIDLASIAHQTKDYIDSMAQDVLLEIVTERDGAFFMNVSGLQGTHSVLRANVFQALAKRLVGDPAPLASSHILLMDKHLSKTPGSTINLPRGLMLTMLYEEIVLSVGVPPCPLPLVEPGALLVPGERDFGGWVISGRIVEGGGILKAHLGNPSGTNPDIYFPRPLTGMVSNEQMSGGLYVRSRRPGDRIQLYTHSRKVQDMFVDAKIPRGWRDQVPIVCRVDTGDLVWVVGLHNPKPFV
jgi:tRNA(Ile)-lysidine synthase